MIRIPKNGFLCLLFSGTVACCQAQVMPYSSTTRSDSATIAASLRYKNPSFFKRLLLGKNYRTTWATPVTLPVFHMQEQGLKIDELGGGQQTRSLHLKDKSGHEWALRSIDKYVHKALPPFLRSTLAEKVTQDMVSAAQPYAPLVVYPLAKAAGVVASKPVYFFVPDDPALEPYDSLFQNTMCLLEDREPEPDPEDAENTEDFVKALLKGPDVQVDQEAVLRARLLDMLIGDWDRHQDQWRWAFKKSNGTKYGYAVPRDRDQALFYSDGFLVKLARFFGLKHFVGFSKNTRKLKQLNAKSWNFDRTFLNELGKDDWSRIMQQFTAALPDSVIHEAVKKFPTKVYQLDGAETEKKLIRRRNSMPVDGLRYYRFLAAQVVITGTNAPDRFVIHTSKDSLTIQQFAGPDFTNPVFSRTFYRRETYQVTVLGLGGADTFIQQGGTPSRIHLKLDGGKGSNQYQLNTCRKIKYYDSDLDAGTYLKAVKKDLRIKD